MYANIYRKASEMANLIQSGQISRVSQLKPESDDSFFRKPQVEEAPKEDKDFDYIVDMMLAMREQASELDLGTKVPTRPKSRGQTSTDVGHRLVGDLMADYGLTRAEAAGIVGNLDHETGGFQFMQEIEPVVPGSRGGFGWAQWTGDRRVDFEDYASNNNLDLISYEANYGNFRRELDETSEGRVLDKIRGLDDATESARVFSETFLRPGIPHMDSRIARAHTYLEGDTE